MVFMGWQKVANQQFLWYKYLWLGPFCLYKKGEMLYVRGKGSHKIH